MSWQPPLTSIAQELLESVIRNGDRAIDATVGKGLDTLFLAQQVGPLGRVVGFDIQNTAIEQTKQRLQQSGLDEQTSLHQTGHQHMREHLPANWQGGVAAVMFNLGYLPGGDKSIITKAENTLKALDQAQELLRPDGVISILAYPGHAGGQQETEQVESWLMRLPRDRYDIKQINSAGPILFQVTGKPDLSKPADQAGINGNSR